MQTCEVTEGGVIVATTLAHSSGEWIRGRLKVTPSKNDAQGIGSAITYARRYSLAAMVGVATEDDDGEAATGRDTKTTKATVRQEPAQAAPKPATPPAPAPAHSEPAQAPQKPGEAYPRRPMDDDHKKAEGVKVESVKEKSGKTAKGKPWTVRFIKFSDGVEAATFSDDLGAIAVECAQSGEEVVYSAKPSDRSPDKLDLITLEKFDGIPF
jgi:hypothetical protein